MWPKIHTNTHIHVYVRTYLSDTRIITQKENMNERKGKKDIRIRTDIIIISYIYFDGRKRYIFEVKTIQKSKKKKNTK